MPNSQVVGRFSLLSVALVLASGLAGLRAVFQHCGAYDPSCAYDDRWACPLAPEENRLAAPIEAGELTYH